jgi:hypothetical protein
LDSKVIPNTGKVLSMTTKTAQQDCQRKVLD